MSITDRLSVSEVEEIQLPLVNRFYKESRYSAKAGRGEVVFVVRLQEGANSKMVAAVRFQEKSDGWWFLRSMCVAPALRGQGVGRVLLDGVQAFLQTRDCFCYPFDHLEVFYQYIGFQAVEEGELPQQPQFMTEPLSRYRRQGRKIVLMKRQRLSA